MEQFILEGIKKSSKDLRDAGKVKVAQNFKCVIRSYIAGRFNAYFVTQQDEETGKKVTTTVLPTEFDSDGNAICPDGAREEPTVRVELSPEIKNGVFEQDTVSGFLLESNVRYLPAGINPVGLVCQATGVKRPIAHGDKKGQDGYYISGLDVLANDNPIVVAMNSGVSLFGNKTE